MFPSGRARLEMNPEPTGSSTITTSGIVVVAFFKRSRRLRAVGNDDGRFEIDELETRERQAMQHLPPQHGSQM